MGVGKVAARVYGGRSWAIVYSTRGDGNAIDNLGTARRSLVVIWEVVHGPGWLAGCVVLDNDPLYVDVSPKDTRPLNAQLASVVCCRRLGEP